MKHLILILLVLFSVIQIQAQQVEIKSSRLHGLLVFVYSNMNRPHYTPYLKKLTDNSEYKDQMRAIGIPKEIQVQILKGKSGLWKWIDKNKNLKAIAIVKDGELSKLFEQAFNAY